MQGDDRHTALRSMIEGSAATIISVPDMLKLNDIHTYYGESYVLHGVSMSVNEGTVVALLGRNGMGKTTLIRSIVGFKPHRIAKKGIGLIPQGRNIFPSLSVKENLTMAARNKGRQGEWTLDKVYSRFPILQERTNLKGNLLSGGEQQMLAICRGLMTNPDLLLMDEPSEGLAPVVVREIGSIIAQLKNEGLSILLVEQNLPMALKVSDYVYIISKGKIVYEATPHELENNEDIKIKYLCAR